MRLEIPDNLVLRGKDLRPSGPTGTALGDINLTVGGDVNIRKNPGGKLTLLGTVETVRGTYQFQGRRFDLVRGGQIRFVGDPDFNPFIDVSATRLIPNTGVEARVRVTGTAKVPELALTSNPPLEESDILALIVFNRPVNELGTGERSSLAATAGGIATGFIAAPLGESIGRALDLDLFEITTNTETGDLGAGVTLGHQIGERTFVKLHQQFGERNITEFMIEFQLARFLRLEATASAGSRRLRQPPQPAPHRARRHRPDLFLQLLARGHVRTARSHVSTQHVSTSHVAREPVSVSPERSDLDPGVVEARAAADVGERIGDQRVRRHAVVGALAPQSLRE